MEAQQPTLHASTPTLADVAREASVHPSTVSRALNPATRHLVGASAVARITEAASRLGYLPHAAAASLRTGRSRLIAVLVPDLLNPVFPLLLRAVEARLGAAGYVTLVADTGNSAVREQYVVERMAAQRVDGLLLATASLGAPAENLCLRFNLPAVLMNRMQTEHGPEGDIPLSAVAAEDGSGVAGVVAHLTGLGHRRLAYIGGPEAWASARNHLAAFRTAAREAGLDVGSLPVMMADAHEREEGARVMRRLLGAKPRPTAIVCASDLLALGACQMVKEAGFSVPGDVSITGYNDIPLLDIVSPPLTTVRVPYGAIGTEAAQILLDEIGAPQKAKRESRLAPELVVRGSTGPAPR